MHEIWEALQFDGIEMPYGQFRTYVCRIRKKGVPAVASAPAYAMGTSSSPSAGNAPPQDVAPSPQSTVVRDPLANLRESERKREREVFNYRPELSGQEKLILKFVMFFSSSRNGVTVQRQTGLLFPPGRLHSTARTADLNSGMMETRHLKNWEEFEDAVADLDSKRTDLESRSSPFYVSPFLFRGQSSSAWTLQTTLERYLPGASRLAMVDYYTRIFAARPQVESVSGRRWELPSPADFRRSLDAQETPSLPGLPGYEFFVYLRHLKFPSPLLDWSRSPYIAAFFAFDGVRNRAGAGDRVAIFAYLEYAGRAKRHSSISTTGPSVRTHQRHVLQQSDYSLCSLRDDGGWYFENHETALAVDAQHELLWKFTIPADEHGRVLRKLGRYNLNAFSLYGSDESFVESIANRELWRFGWDGHRLPTARRLLAPI